MGNRIKLLVIVLLFLLGIAFYWNYSSSVNETSSLKSVTESNHSENFEEVFQASKVSKNITNEVNSEKKENIVSYKDVFKEPRKLQTDIEKINDREGISQIDSEVKELILEADALIKEKNLHLKKEELNQDSLEKYNYEIEKMENKLDKLEIE